jgi:hypothetical protein
VREDGPTPTLEECLVAARGKRVGDIASDEALVLLRSQPVPQLTILEYQGHGVMGGEKEWAYGRVREFDPRGDRAAFVFLASGDVPLGSGMLYPDATVLVLPTSPSDEPEGRWSAVRHEGGLDLHLPHDTLVRIVFADHSLKVLHETGRLDQLIDEAQW